MTMGRWDLDQVHGIGHTVRTCGIEAKRLAKQGFQVYEKATDDFVTDVDRTLDRYLTETFTRQFPDDGLVTEENNLSLQQFWQPHARLWCIDPLDGTQDFIKGDPGYAVMVGAIADRMPIAGWIYAPETDRLYYGGPELGLWQVQDGGNSVPLQADRLTQSATVILGYKDFHSYGRQLQAKIPSLRFENRPGSFGLKVLEVLRGQAGLYMYFNQRVKVWDTVAPLALAQTAGMMCCDLNGRPIRYTPNSLNPMTLAHLQPIVIGWQPLVETWLPQIRQIVQAPIP
jgi:3'(2'), 5'-bisphosphate nucleotidase